MGKLETTADGEYIDEVTDERAVREWGLDIVEGRLAFSIKGGGAEDLGGDAHTEEGGDTTDG